MSVATLIITKPGGLTTSEALAKGLPVIAMDPIPGQEVKNAHFITQTQVGWELHGTAELPPLIERLLAHPQELENFAANALRLGHADSATDVARLILGSG